jgi:hypothetical protein
MTAAEFAAALSGVSGSLCLAELHDERTSAGLDGSLGERTQSRKNRKSSQSGW